MRGDFNHFFKSVCQFHGSYPPPPYSFDTSFTDEIVACSYTGPQIKRFSRSKSRALWAQWFLLVSMREPICSSPTVPAVDKKKNTQQHPWIDAQRAKKKKRGFQCRANVDGFLHLYLRIIFLFSLCFIFWSYLRIILWIEKSFLSYIGFSKDKKK